LVNNDIWTKRFRQKNIIGKINGSTFTSHSNVSEIAHFDLDDSSLNLTGNLTTPGVIRWNVSSGDSAHQRADARDDAGNFSRLHWYGVRDNGATSNFRHAWYDGSDYVDIDVSSGGIDFGGSATHMTIGGDTVWHNGNFEPIVDNLDVLPTFTSSDEDYIKYNTTERAVEIQGSDDSFGAVWPAIKIESGVSYKISFSIKASAVASSGVYFRPQEYDSALPGGKTHIGNSATHSEVQEDTRQISSLYENQAIGTSWEQHSFFYTPTSTASWWSPMFLNWTGLGTNSLFVKNLRIDAIKELPYATNTDKGAVRMQVSGTTLYI